MYKNILLLLSFVLVASITACSAINKMKMLKADNPTIDDPQTLTRGLAVYKNHCLRCHGEKGLGDGPDAKALNKKPTDLQNIAKNKSANSIAANIVYGKGKLMPAFENILSDTEAWDAANYVKSWSKTSSGKK